MICSRITAFLLLANPALFSAQEAKPARVKITPAVLTHKVEADFSSCKKKSAPPHEVQVQITFDVDGKVVKAQLVRASENPCYDQAAVDAANHYIIRPPTRDGKPYSDVLYVNFEP